MLSFSVCLGSRRLRQRGCREAGQPEKQMRSEVERSCSWNSPLNLHQVVLNPCHSWASVGSELPRRECKKRNTCKYVHIYGHSYFCSHQKAWPWPWVVSRMQAAMLLGVWREPHVGSRLTCSRDCEHPAPRQQLERKRGMSILQPQDLNSANDDVSLEKDLEI